MSTAPHPDRYFYSVWRNFSTSLGSLRLFSKHIKAHSDQVDQDLIYRAAASLAKLLSSDTAEILSDLEAFIPSLEEAHIYPDFREDAQAREIIAAFQDSDFKARLQGWITENPLDGAELMGILWDVFYQPPINGILLRRSVFVQLFGTIDILFKSLCEGYRLSQKQPHKCPSTSWKKRLEHFAKLGIDIAPIQDYLDEFAEMAQRRNLLVHQAGLIDERYMKHTPPQFRPPDAKPGRILLVPDIYLQRAFYLVTIIGFWLTQSGWRKWNPHKRLEKAHKAAHEAIYQTLYQEESELTIALAQMMEQFSIPRKHKIYRHYILVNQAIAYRELGETTKMRRMISRLRQTKHDWLFDIAIAVLKKDFTKVRTLLIAAKRRNELHHLSPYWPLFAPISGHHWFKEIFAAADLGCLPRR